MLNKLVSTVFLCIFSVSLLFYLICLLWYWKRRQAFAIQARLFEASLSTHICLFTFNILQVWTLAYEVILIQPFMKMFAWKLLLVHILGVTYALRALILYVRLKVADEKIKLRTSLASANTPLNRHKYNLYMATTESPRVSIDCPKSDETDAEVPQYWTSIPWLAFYVLVLTLPALAATIYATFLDIVGDLFRECIFVFCIVQTFDIFLIIFILMRLWGLQDSFGVKREIKISLFSAIGLFLGYFSLSMLLPDNPTYNTYRYYLGFVVSFCLISTQCLFGVLRPILVSLYEEKARKTFIRLSPSSEFEKLFLAIINNRHAYEMFEQHVAKEFSLENLEFVKHTKKVFFMIESQVSHDKISKMLSWIAETYVQQDAIYQVNLPFDQRKNLQDSIAAFIDNKDTSLEESIQEDLMFAFESAEATILDLLINDSFRRFRETDQYNVAIEKVRQKEIIGKELRKSISFSIRKRSESLSPTAMPSGLEQPNIRQSAPWI